MKPLNNTLDLGVAGGVYPSSGKSFLPRPYQTRATLAAIAAYQREENPLLVLPCGAGKSVIQSFIIREIIRLNQQARILCTAHVKELVAQNAEKANAILGAKAVGICSSGLDSHKLEKPITFATVQTLAKRLSNIPSQDVLIIDEAHLCGQKENLQYQHLVTELRSKNPKLIIVGMTGTPFRLEGGLLFGKDRHWKEITYRIDMKELLRDGALCPVISQAGLNPIDINNLQVNDGEYSKDDLASAFIPQTSTHVNDIIRYGHDRKRWLIFGSTIDHAASLHRELVSNGIPSGIIDSKTKQRSRDTTISEFKTGNIRALVNCGVLTTGFDCPEVDLIAIVRATKSPALLTQMVGRGQRPAHKKENCLILDYGEHFSRFGVIENIVENEISKLSIDNSRTTGSYAHKTAIEQKREEFHGNLTNAPVSLEELRTRAFQVVDISVPTIGNKPGKPPYVKLGYKLENGKTVNEFIFPNHEGFPRTKALQWVSDHGLKIQRDDLTPENLAKEIKKQTRSLRWPSHVYIKPNGDFLNISQKIFDEGAGR